MAKPVELVIYSKPECHLCDEMTEIIKLLADKIPITLKQVDITKNPELEKQYGMDIPVLFCGGKRIAEHRITEKELLDKINPDNS